MADSLMKYQSSFSGPEIDAAVQAELGDVYGENNLPGCRLIGSEQANPAYLRETIIPGAYTAIFYTDGPDELMNIVAPIRMHVYYGPEVNDPDNTEGLIQTILCGAILYWRNLESTNPELRFVWTRLDLGVQQITIIDNLLSTSNTAALSANMGRYLKFLLDNLQIGGPNLLFNSGFTNPTNPSIGWQFTTCASLSDQFLGFESNAKTRIVDIDSSTLTDADITSVRITNEYTPLACATPMEYTASVYVPSVFDLPTGVDSAQVFIQIGFLNSAKNAYIKFKTTNVVLTKEQCQQTLQRISVTDTSPNETSYIDVVYGVIGKGKVSMSTAKLEMGKYALGWQLSYLDGYEEYINATKFHNVDVTMTDIDEQQAFIYDKLLAKFRNEYVAIGGGGGFVISKTPPSCEKVLWLNTNDHNGKLYRYNAESVPPSWIKVVLPPFEYLSADPTDTERFWLDVSESNEIDSAVLKYYDLATKTYRPVTGKAGKIFEESLVPPEDHSILWIHTTTHVERYYSETLHDWTIVRATWG